MPSRGQLLLAGVALVATLVAGLLAYLAPGASVPGFVVSGVALAALAGVVGEATNQLANRLGPGLTGVIQSAIGNLPELFVSIFALRAGLVDVVRTSLIGSILGNSLLVLGLALIAGGLRHGTLRFASATPRTIA